MSSKDLQAVGSGRQDGEDGVYTVSVVHASLPLRDYRRRRLASCCLSALLTMEQGLQACLQRPCFARGNPSAGPGHYSIETYIVVFDEGSDASQTSLEGRKNIG